MKVYKQSKEEDIQDLKFMKQMIQEADKQLRFNEINYKEYQYILSRTLAYLEAMEVKYGL